MAIGIRKVLRCWERHERIMSCMLCLYALNAYLQSGGGAGGFVCVGESEHPNQRPCEVSRRNNVHKFCVYLLANLIQSLSPT